MDSNCCPFFFSNNNYYFFIRCQKYLDIQNKNIIFVLQKNKTK